MLSDIWPVYRLQITTDRLILRLPNERELAEVAEVAGAGVHPASERPFLSPWTEGSPLDRARSVVRGHWGQLAGWTADRWGLGLCVFADGQPIGMVSVRAHDFRVVREVTTSSWLGLPYQGKGFGTEARIGLLTLAFDQLDAEAARTEVFQDNHSSQGVASGISKHLMALRAANLVTATKVGRTQRYRLNAATMSAALEPWLAHYEPYFSDALTRLQRLVELDTAPSRET